MEKIKILISAQDSGGLGGTEKFIESLANQFKSRKTKVEFTTYEGSLFNHRIKYEGFTTWEIPVRMDITGNLRGLIKYFLFLPLTFLLDLFILAKFKKGGGNILLLTGISDKLVLTPLAGTFSIPVVWIEFAPLSQVFRKNLSIPKIFYRLIKDIPALVIVPTENTKKHLVYETGIREKKIRVIPCGIDIVSAKKLQEINSTKKVMKRKLGFENKKVIGMVSRIEKEKGQDTLIEAGSFLLRKVKDFVIVIVGDGNNDYLKKLVEKYNLAGKVLFLGYRDDLFEVMSTFDVFVFPSRWEMEGFGIVLLEAMMMGIPIVATSFGPIPEVANDSACLVGSKPEDVAQGIEKVLADKKYAQTLIEKGQKRIKMFDISYVAEKYLDEIKNICAIH